MFCNMINEIFGIKYGIQCTNTVEYKEIIQRNTKKM